MTRRTTAIAIAWTLLVLVLCWTPRRQMPVSEHGLGFLSRLPVDKIVHLAMFAGFAFLWRRASGPSSLVVVAVSGIALGIITEVVQELPVINRDGDVRDFLADALGVGVGLVAARWLEGVRRGSPARPVEARR